MIVLELFLNLLNMICLNHISLLILFSLLTFIPFGKSVELMGVTSKSCKLEFFQSRDNPGRYLCNDTVSTWSYPIEECKPNIDVKSPPKATKCISPHYPNIQNGLCPTYRATTYTDRGRNITGFACDLRIRKGTTVDQDLYSKFNCEILTNMISCKGRRGRAEKPGVE
ncbi:hypothetical protein DFH28DRAFT_945898 [Melampsora americana]|nr:hypothetical protein DFH28DRAFT_945898 [Melampsora americana]